MLQVILGAVMDSDSHDTAENLLPDFKIMNTPLDCRPPVSLIYKWWTQWRDVIGSSLSLMVRPSTWIIGHMPLLWLYHIMKRFIYSSSLVGSRLIQRRDDSPDYSGLSAWQHVSLSLKCLHRHLATSL